MWPVQSDGELRALRELARTFGAALTTVEAGAEAPPQSPVHSADDTVVVALSPDVEGLARLHGDLTGRRTLCARSPKDLDGEQVEVVVGHADQISNGLLARLYDVQRPRIPGLVVGWTPEELRTQVLISSAASVLTHGSLGGDVALVPATPASMTLSRIKIYGADAGAEEIDAALSSEKDILAVFAHSDGLDAELGGRILCSVKSPRTAQETARAPKCVVTGTCHRMGTDIRAALSSDSLLPPELMRARVLIMYVCWGFLANDSIIHPRWSYCRRLLTAGRVGAILTPWNIVFGDANDMFPLLEDLWAGTPVGPSVNAFHGRSPVRECGVRMCVLGDPRARAVGPESRHAA